MFVSAMVAFLIMPHVVKHLGQLFSGSQVVRVVTTIIILAPGKYQLPYILYT